MTSVALATRTKTNRWFKGMMSELKKDGDNFAYAATRAVLYAFKERLPEDQAAQAAARLPILLAGIYVSGWHTGKSEEKDRKEFFEKLKAESRGRETDAEKISERLFELLEHYLTPAEVEEMISGLPKEMKNMWPAENDFPERSESSSAAVKKTKTKEKLSSIERLRRKFPPIH